MPANTELNIDWAGVAIESTAPRPLVFNNPCRFGPTGFTKFKTPLQNKSLRPLYYSFITH